MSCYARFISKYIDMYTIVLFFQITKQTMNRNSKFGFTSENTDAYNIPLLCSG